MIMDVALRFQPVWAWPLLNHYSCLVEDVDIYSVRAVLNKNKF